jgi:hypothetical protein
MSLVTPGFQPTERRGGIGSLRPDRPFQKENPHYGERRLMPQQIEDVRNPPLDAAGTRGEDAYSEFPGDDPAIAPDVGIDFRRIRGLSRNDCAF